MKNTEHSLYNLWCMIKQRCNNPKHTYYHLYGAKGVRMCDRWANSFEAFIQDVGDRPSAKHTIDRFPDKNGNYGPDNFRWATWAEQNGNRNEYAAITIRFKKNISYAAYQRKYKVGEKFDKQDLINDLKEQFPTCKIIDSSGRANSLGITSVGALSAKDVMLNIQTSPAIPFDCLQLMRLVQEVEFKLAGQESIWCLAVKGAIRSNKPARVILDTIKDMATDNYNAVADVLGISLTNKILNV